MIGSIGLSTEDEVRMIERNEKQIPKGTTIYYTEFRQLDTKYNTSKWITRTTLPTTDRERAQIQYRNRLDNPHMKDVKFCKGRM